jgi:hypothetical protein
VKLPTSTHPKAIWLLVAVLAAVSPLALAELPPFAYRNAQQGAPESLVIKALSVKQAVGDDPERRSYVTKAIHVTVEAQVQTVERSRSGLKRKRVTNPRVDSGPEGAVSCELLKAGA